MLTTRMILFLSRFFIGCSVSFAWSYSAGSTRIKHAGKTVSGIRPIPFFSIWLFMFSRAWRAAIGLLFCGIENSWNLSKRCCVATSFSGSYHFPRNSKTSLGDQHRFRIALSRSEVLRPVWGYPAVGTIHGASGVCMRCVRRDGSVWLVVSDRCLTAGRPHRRTTSLQDDLIVGRYACMS